MRDLSGLALYQTAYCPFCARVRGLVQRLGLDLELRDVDARAAWRRELVEATGRQTVPCLRIERTDGAVEWMHESQDIIAYLKERFGSGDDGLD